MKDPSQREQARDTASPIADAGLPRRRGSVRLLTSPEELDAALRRMEEFERRKDELLASRAERHRALLASALERTELTAY